MWSLWEMWGLKDGELMTSAGKSCRKDYMQIATCVNSYTSWDQQLYRILLKTHYVHVVRDKGSEGGWTNDICRKDYKLYAHCNLCVNEYGYCFSYMYTSNSYAELHLRLATCSHCERCEVWMVVMTSAGKSCRNDYANRDLCVNEYAYLIWTN